jgi:hypothetical protein
MGIGVNGLSGLNVVPLVAKDSGCKRVSALVSQKKESNVMDPQQKLLPAMLPHV